MNLLLLIQSYSYLLINTFKQVFSGIKINKTKSFHAITDSKIVLFTYIALVFSIQSPNFMDLLDLTM
jgi:hypothetical protein